MTSEFYDYKIVHDVKNNTNNSIRYDLQMQINLVGTYIKTTRKIIVQGIGND